MKNKWHIVFISLHWVKYSSMLKYIVVPKNPINKCHQNITKNILSAKNTTNYSPNKLSQLNYSNVKKFNTFDKHTINHNKYSLLKQKADITFFPYIFREPIKTICIDWVHYISTKDNIHINIEMYSEYESCKPIDNHTREDMGTCLEKDIIDFAMVHTFEEITVKIIDMNKLNFPNLEKYLRQHGIKLKNIKFKSGMNFATYEEFGKGLY
jgi:hypothetical protein